MKFSIIQMLIFFACFSLALLLSTNPGYISMAIILFVVITPLFFIVEVERWRSITYGGLLGIFVFWIIASSATYLLHIHLPRPPIQSRYDSGIPVEQIEFAKRVFPYIVPLGFLFGATANLVFASWSRERRMQFEQAQLTQCDNCGRVLSVHSTICPRCERRVDSASRQDSSRA